MQGKFKNCQGYLMEYLIWEQDVSQGTLPWRNALHFGQGRVSSRNSHWEWNVIHAPPVSIYRDEDTQQVSPRGEQMPGLLCFRSWLWPFPVAFSWKMRLLSSLESMQMERRMQANEKVKRLLVRRRNQPWIFWGILCTVHPLFLPFLNKRIHESVWPIKVVLGNA